MAGLFDQLFAQPGDREPALPEAHDILAWVFRVQRTPAARNAFQTRYALDTDAMATFDKLVARLDLLLNRANQHANGIANGNGFTAEHRQDLRKYFRHGARADFYLSWISLLGVQTKNLAERGLASEAAILAELDADGWTEV